MFLSDRDIKKNLEEGKIVIKDYDESRLNPCSYDICLGNEFILTDSYNTKFIDPDKNVAPVTYEVKINDGEEFILHPGVSILGISKEHFGSDNYLIYLSGKSSLARIGLLVHNTASIVHPGHYVNIVFELCNLNCVPIILRPGMRIAQLLFGEISSTPERLYNQVGRYATNKFAGFVPPSNSNVQL